MSRKPAPHYSEPICDQVCWEWTDADRLAWVYTRSVHHCGHYLDPDTRTWKWDIRKTGEMNK